MITTLQTVQQAPTSFLTQGRGRWSLCFSKIWGLGVLLGLGLFCLSWATQAQQRGRSGGSLARAFKASPKMTIEAAAGFTVMNSDYSSEQSSAFDLVKTKGLGLTGGLGFAYQVTPYLAALASVDYHRVQGTSAGKDHRSFTSELMSATGSAVWHVSSKNMLGRLYDPSFRKGIAVVPYLKAGAGVLRYTATSKGPLKDAPAAATDPATALVIPLGAGIKCRISQQLSLASDFTYAMPSSDFLDNKKGSGSILGTNDKYGSVTMKALYTLPW